MRRGYRQTEAGLIPEEWDCERVADAAATTSNAIVGGPFGSDLTSGDYTTTGVPVIRGQNMVAKFVSGDFVYVSSRKAKSLSSNLAYPSDIIFTQRGTLGQVSIVPEGLFPNYLVSQSQMKVSLNRNRHDPEFVYQYFQGDEGQKQIISSAIQTGVPHTNLGILRSYHFPAPPLREQRAIAKALSDVDALLDGLDRLIAKKRDLKHAAMQQLLTGRSRLPGFSEEWEPKQLTTVGRCLRGVSYQGDVDLSPYDTPQTKRLLRANNVQEATVVTSDVQFVNASRVSQTQVLKQNDILICMANGSRALVGKAGLFAVDDGYEYTFGAFMGCFRTEPESAHAGFVFSLFQTKNYRDYINILLAGSTINNLRPASIESLVFSFPPLPEQVAIAGVLSGMEAELSALEARLDKTRTLKNAMMQELLTGRVRLVKAEPVEPEAAYA